MGDMAPTIVPKSDQLNADDLISGPRTITITKVLILGEPDQPVAVHFEGDEGRSFKPCKSMRRVMVHIWGGDSKEYPGKQMTLYRDASITFGRDAVGGIRISHMSGIDRDIAIPLMVTRGQRKPYTVKPLKAAAKKQMPPAETWPEETQAALNEAVTEEHTDPLRNTSMPASWVQAFQTASEPCDTPRALLDFRMKYMEEVRAIFAAKPSLGEELDEWFGKRLRELKAKPKQGE